MNPKRTPFRISNEERKGVLFLLLVLCVIKSLHSLLTEGYQRVVFNPDRFEISSEEKKVIDTTRIEEIQIGTITNKITSPNEPIYKRDLNRASATDLKKIRGIGPVLSERIIKYGHSLNGYSDINQLYRVYGLDSVVVDRIKEAFEIRSDTIIPMNIRLASREELSTLPYLSQSEIDWLISLRNRPEGLGSKEFVTNLLLKTLNKNEKLLVYLNY
ncbi:MAG: helix-hairpin-helix domain-containing protein [Flavobacteriaceae bacterium]